MATTLSSPLPDPGGCLICQRLALAVVLVDLANTSKEIIRCFSITARFAGSHRSLRPDTARLPVQSVPVAIRQKWESAAFSGVSDNSKAIYFGISRCLQSRCSAGCATRPLPLYHSNIL